jgi:putative flippase GtrA
MEAGCLMLPLANHPEVRRVFSFLAAGLANTAFGYGAYALCIAIGTTPAAAVVISTVAGVAFNYRTLGAVFAARGFARLPQFLMAYGALIPLNIALVRLAQGAGANPYLAGAVALAAVVPLTYTAMRLFVFPQPASHRPAA